MVKQLVTLLWVYKKIIPATMFLVAGIYFPLQGQYFVEESKKDEVFNGLYFQNDGGISAFGDSYPAGQRYTSKEFRPITYRYELVGNTLKAIDFEEWTIGNRFFECRQVLTNSEELIVVGESVNVLGTTGPAVFSIDTQFTVMNKIWESPYPYKLYPLRWLYKSASVIFACLAQNTSGGVDSLMLIEVGFDGITIRSKSYTNFDNAAWSGITYLEETGEVVATIFGLPELVCRIDSNFNLIQVEELPNKLTADWGDTTYYYNSSVGAVVHGNEINLFCRYREMVKNDENRKMAVIRLNKQLQTLGTVLLSPTSDSLHLWGFHQNKNGEILITGVDGSKLSGYPKSYSNDIIYTMIDSSLTEKWSGRFIAKGLNRNHSANYNNGSWYIAGGVFDNTVDLEYDPFILKISNQGVVSSVFQQKSITPLVFPNPTSNSVKIRIDHKTMIDYAVYSITGKKIREGTFSEEIVLDLSNESAGVYHFVSNLGSATIQVVR